MPFIHYLSYWFNKILAETIKWRDSDWYYWLVGSPMWILRQMWAVNCWAWDVADELLYWMASTLWPYVQDTWAYVAELSEWMIDTVWPKVQEIESTVLSLGDLVVKTIVPTLESIGNALIALQDDFYDVVWPLLNQIVSALNGIFDYVYNILVPALNGLLVAWNEFYTTWSHVILPTIEYQWRKLDALQVALENFETAIYDYVNYVWAWLYDHFNDRLNAVAVWVDAEISNVWDYLDALHGWFTETVGKLVSDVEHIFSFLEDAFEDSFTLRDRAVQSTTEKHGVTLWSEIFGYIPKGTWDNLTGSPSSPPIEEMLSHYTKQLDLGKDGSWRDVDDFLNEACKKMDDGLDPGSFNIDKRLLSPGDRDHYEAGLKRMEEEVTALEREV